MSGAPQCPIPEQNMGNSMMQAQYDYLCKNLRVEFTSKRPLTVSAVIQFYNNNCAAADLVKDSNNNPQGPGGTYNLADWPGYLSGGASANARLHVGLPGDKAEAGDYHYVPTYSLPEVVANSEGVAGFNGIMIYDAGDSDVPNVNGCNYAQQARRVLDTGSAC